MTLNYFDVGKLIIQPTLFWF